MIQRYLLPVLAVLVPGAPAWAAEALGVAVSVPPQAYFVERIGGEHVSVSVLVPPGRSPATYDPTPKQVAALQAARVYFRIGVPFERAWMERLRSAAPQLRVVDLRDALPGDPEGADDPHVWTSPPRVIEMAGLIRDSLIDADPGHASDYRRGHAALVDELRALDAEIRRLLGDRGGTLLVYHPAWSHFAATYGLEQVAIEAHGREPSARHLAEVTELARRRGVGTVFVQRQFSDRAAQTVADAIGADVVVLDPLAADYPEAMRRAARAFAAEVAQP